MKDGTVFGETLSNREQEVADAYAKGQSYKEIARDLGISPSTVRTYLSAIYRKLDVSSKVALSHALAARNHTDTPPTLDRPDKPSIAVLAFENMSADPDQTYFSDGISEDIITALSRSPWLFVIARNTTFTYKNQPVDIKRVAQELGVRFVLEGSVRRAGNRIRVTAQLIDGASGGHVWSERYDGQVDDVFDLQDEITRNVTASIQTAVQLSMVEEPVERSNRPNLTVWELTMRAWQLAYGFNTENFVAAKALLEKALSLDPNSAEANMVLSLLYHHADILGITLDKQNARKRAYEFGRRAVELDGLNEYSQWALGISCWALDKHQEGLIALNRAVELNSNCSLAHGSLGTALALVGRTEEAIQHQDIAIRTNPRDPSIFFRFSGLSLAHYMADRYEEAILWAERSIARKPEWSLAYFLLAASQVALNRNDAARDTVTQCTSRNPDVKLRDLDGFPIAIPEKQKQLSDRLETAGFK